MRACLTIAVFVVAVSAAVRSTWSPCGLSMLSTITPVSERAKGHSYRATSAWFVFGAVSGGLTLGALMALLAAGVASAGPSSVAVALVVSIAAVVAGLSDL